jgi:hypothetical protein
MKIAKPTSIAPDAYQLIGSLDLSKDKRLALIINIAGTVLLFLFAALFAGWVVYIRPNYGNVFNLTISSLGDLLKIILTLLVITVIMVTAHEGLHGLFFWVYTRQRPAFGFRGYYAFASAPRWYIPRNPYLVICLAPFVVITAVGLGLIAFVPEAWIAPLVLLLSLNAAGAIGDLMVAFWILGKPSWFLIQDFGDGVKLYGLPVND